MFEFGYDQASGLRASPSGKAPVVIPVATTSRPGQAYEMLCNLASQLSALGRDAVIVDGSAHEVGEHRTQDGSHLGLVHALQDPAIGGLGAPLPSAEWLVMPGAIGLQTLQQTARAAGAAVALSRLLAPFASGAVVILYAPATTISALFAGLQVQAIVPVLAMPQATIDAYGSIKVLHAAGLSPVLAPMASEVEPSQAPLAQVVRSVRDCAQRYLDLPVEQWAFSEWGLHVQEAAIGAPWMPGTQPAPTAPSSVAYFAQATANSTLWS